MRNFNKHKKEMEIILFMILVTIILGFVIYIRGYLLAPEDRFFIGHPHVKDSTTYFAKMLQGSRKGILFYKNHLTTEPHQKAILFNFFLVMGKLSALLHMKFITMFHITRVIWSFLLLGYLYLISFRFFKRSYERIGFMALCCFSSGLPALEDANIFRSISIYPHFAAAMLFLVMYYYNFWKLSLRPSSRTPVALCSISLFMIGIIHPWHFLPMSIVSLLIIVFIWLRGRFRITRFLITGYSIMFIIPLGFAVLYTHTLRTNEVFRKVSSQNVIYFATAWEFIKTYGILWIPTLGGVIVSLFRYKKSPMLLHALWLLTTISIMIFPLSFEGRLIEGLHIPVCFLTMYGIIYVASVLIGKYHITRKTATVLGVFIILALSVYANIKFFTFPTEEDFVLTDKYPVVEVLDFMKWSRENLPEDVNVLASWETSQFLARTVLVNTYVCHPIETIDFDNKLDIMYRFFSGWADPWGMTVFLKQNKIDYVIHDLYSPFMQDFKPIPCLEPIYRIENVLTVYKVKR